MGLAPGGLPLVVYPFVILVLLAVVFTLWALLKYGRSLFDMIIIPAVRHVSSPPVSGSEYDFIVVGGMDYASMLRQILNVTNLLFSVQVGLLDVQWHLDCPKIQTSQCCYWRLEAMGRC